MKNREPTRSGSAPFLWQALASTRLTILLLALLLLLTISGSFIAQEATSPVSLARFYTPDTLYFMKIAGLTDIYHSGWFIFILIALLLNLLINAFSNLPTVFRQSKQKFPHAIHAEVAMGSKRQERYVHVEFATAIGREPFREVVMKWAGSKVGRVKAVRDEGGLNELQIVAQEGRFNRLIGYGMHLSLLLILTGGVLQGLLGFEGKISIDEGAKTNFVEILKGSPAKWAPHEELGRVMPGFFEPGFEIEATEIGIDFYPGTESPRQIRSKLSFTEKGASAETRNVSVTHSALFRGLRFFQTDYARTGQMSMTATITDRRDGSALLRSAMGRGTTLKLDGAAVKVVDIQESVEELGSAAELEYTPEGGETETFWIFKNYPGYDPIHRKNSRYTFTVESLRPRFNTELIVTKNPGLYWNLIGAALFMVTLLLTLFFSQNRFWFVWTPGKVRVLAASSKFWVFEPRFNRMMAQFKHRVTRMAKG